MRNGIRKVMVLLVILIPAFIFVGISFMHYTAFFGLDSFKSQCNVFLGDMKNLAAVGKKNLSEYDGMDWNVYDVDTMNQESSSRFAYSSFSGCEDIMVLRQGDKELLLAGSRDLYVYDIEKQGALRARNEGEPFYLINLNGAPRQSLWRVSENAVFIARSNNDTLMGVIQDGDIKTLNISKNEHFTSNIKVIYPGLATLMVYLENGEKWYIGQFLIDGKIPVVSEAERDELYAQYNSLYFGGELIKKVAVDDEDLIHYSSSLDGWQEKIKPLADYEDRNWNSWEGNGHPYGFGSEEDQLYFYHVLPYGYTIVGNIESDDEMAPETYVVDTFTGEIKVDLSAFVAAYAKENNGVSPYFFSEQSTITRNENEEDILLIDNAYMNLTTGDSKILMSDTLNKLEANKWNNLGGYFIILAHSSQGLILLGLISIPLLGYALLVRRNNVKK